MRDQLSSVHTVRGGKGGEQQHDDQASMGGNRVGDDDVVVLAVNGEDIDSGPNTNMQLVGKGNENGQAIPQGEARRPPDPPANNVSSVPENVSMNKSRKDTGTREKHNNVPARETQAASALTNRPTLPTEPKKQNPRELFAKYMEEWLVMVGRIESGLSRDTFTIMEENQLSSIIDGYMADSDQLRALLEEVLEDVHQVQLE